MNWKATPYVELLVLLGLDGIRIARDFIEYSGFSLSEENLEKLTNWLTEESCQGNVRAQHALAEFYARGVFGVINRKLGYKWCLAAAEKNYAPAIFLLSAFYEDYSDGVKDNINKSLEMQKKAASLNYPTALRSLGVEYSAGKIVPKNENVSLNYFEQAANLGDAESMFRLSVSLMSSLDKDDIDKGIKWLYKASELENPSAMRRLASYYLTGQHGVQVDKDKAEELNQKANIIEKPYSYEIDQPKLLN